MAGKYTTAFTMLMNFFMIKRYLILFLSQLIKIKFIIEILIKDLTRILKCRVLISKCFQLTILILSNLKYFILYLLHIIESLYDYEVFWYKCGFLVSFFNVVLLIYPSVHLFIKVVLLICFLF